MTQTPTISVIIPCYNGARFLSRSIRSALEQTYRPVEVIVVDDGSGDESLEVANANPGVQVISQPHSGQSIARNTGLKVAGGEYLVFLDSDDILLPKALNVGRKALTEHQECGFVFGFCEYISVDGSLLPTPYVPKVRKDFYRRLLRQNFIQISGVMFRRSVVDHFRADVDGCEDWDLYLRIARKRDIYCHGEVVSQYRRHAGNTSANKERMIKSAIGVLENQLKDVSGDRALEKLCRESIRSLRLELAGWRNLRRDLFNVVQMARNSMAKLLTESPS